MRTIFVVCLLTLFMACAHAMPKNETVTLPTRPGVTQPLFIAYDDERPARQVAILFPGGYGAVKVGEDNGKPLIKIGGNFLVRSRNLFVEEGIAAVVVDAPSDQREGMADAFRNGSAHAADIAAVLDLVRGRFPDAKIFLVGTSRGTISVAALANPLADKLAGVILTSAVYQVPAFTLQRFNVPALLVHNAEDGCPVCPYRAAQAAAKKYNLPLVTITGGKAPLSEPCEAYSRHGFFGKEREAVQSMADWMRTQ